MMKRVEDIMITDFEVVNALDSVQKVIDLSLATNHQARLLSSDRQ